MSPSDEIVKYFLTRPEIYNGKRITSHTISKFRNATAEALKKVMGITITVQSASEKEVLTELSSSETLQGLSKQIEAAIGVPLKVSEISGGLKNAECTIGEKRYRIRWNEKKPRYNVTEYANNTYKLYFCNNIDDVCKVVKG